MNIFVTGAAGFIGSHVCDYFIDKGFKITGIDNFDNFYPIHLKQMNVSGLIGHKNFNLFEGDIRNDELLDRIFSENKFDAVIHLAAKAGVRPSIDSIKEYYDVNVNGTISLLETMKAHDVKKMLFASSSSVYGNSKKVPFSESDFVDNPISPYAASKKSGELLCQVYCHLNNFNITCLRFFTVYGPRQRPDLAIHKFTRLIDTGNPIPFYGDGTTSRDYTYIEDIVDGISRALNNLDGYRIYNLGESNTITLAELVELIETNLGKRALINKITMQPGDVNRTFADISRARAELGYSPKYNIEDGIRLFVNWYHTKFS